jgi:hypothetical protein
VEVAMNIELTDDEVVVLHEVLTHRLGDLAVEIRHTDNRDFRAGLTHRRDLLRRVHALLAVPSADPPIERQPSL